MSTYGTRTVRFLEVTAYAHQSCEDYRKPSRPTYVLEVNGLRVSVTFRSHGRWWYFSAGRWWLEVGTRWLLLDGEVDMPFLARTEIRGDYPDETYRRRHEMRRP